MEHLDDHVTSRPSPASPELLSRLKGLEIRARSIVEGHLAGLHRSPRKGFSVEFAEHRNYAPGDDLRYLDWKVFAKRNRFYVKQFEEETNFACYLMVDCSESMSYRSRHSPLSKWEYAGCLTAALAWLVLRQQDAISVTLFDNSVREILRPSAQAAQFKQVVRLLEETEPRSRSSIGEMLHAEAERIRRRSIVFVVSDFFDEPESVLEGLRHLQFCGHDVGILHVFDPAEEEFPFQEPTEFVGLEETGEESLEPQSLAGAYRREFADYLKTFLGGCRAIEVDYARARTDLPVDQVLSQFLSRRKSGSRGIR